jgi:glutathione S-transferase
LGSNEVATIDARRPKVQFIVNEHRSLLRGPAANARPYSARASGARLAPLGSTNSPIRFTRSGFPVEDRLTLADIAVASPFANLAHCGVDIGERPKLKAYVDGILSRPSFAGWVARESAFLVDLEQFQRAHSDCQS